MPSEVIEIIPGQKTYIDMVVQPPKVVEVIPRYSRNKWGSILGDLSDQEDLIEYIATQIAGAVPNVGANRVAFGDPVTGALSSIDNLKFENGTFKVLSTARDKNISQFGNVNLWTNFNDFPDRTGIEVGGLFIHNAPGAAYIQDNANNGISILTPGINLTGSLITANYLYSGRVIQGVYGVQALANQALGLYGHGGFGYIQIDSTGNNTYVGANFGYVGNKFEFSTNNFLKMITPGKASYLAGNYLSADNDFAIYSYIGGVLNSSITMSGSVLDYNNPNGHDFRGGRVKIDATLNVNAAGVPLFIDSTNGNSAKIGLKDLGVARSYFGCDSTYPFTVLDNTGNYMLAINPDKSLRAMCGLMIESILEFADNAAAAIYGLPLGMIYRTGDILKIRH